MRAEHSDGGNDVETKVFRHFRQERILGNTRQDLKKDYPKENPKAKKEMKEIDLEALKQSQHELAKKKKKNNWCLSQR